MGNEFPSILVRTLREIPLWPIMVLPKKFPLETKSAFGNQGGHAWAAEEDGFQEKGQALLPPGKTGHFATKDYIHTWLPRVRVAQ